MGRYISLSPSDIVLDELSRVFLPKKNNWIRLFSQIGKSYFGEEKNKLNIGVSHLVLLINYSHVNLVTKLKFFMTD